MPTIMMKCLRRIGLSEPTAHVPPPKRPVELGQRFDRLLDKWWERLTQIAFALFVGCLVALLAILYAGVPII
jgi:hypothetical protein